MLHACAVAQMFPGTQLAARLRQALKVVARRVVSMRAGVIGTLMLQHPATAPVLIITNALKNFRMEFPKDASGCNTCPGFELGIDSHLWPPCMQRPGH